MRYPYVWSLTRRTKLLLATASVDLVLDVGAHIGGYGLELRRLGYTGPLISFEPVFPVYVRGVEARFPNMPEDPDLAIAAGRKLCQKLLQPLHDTFTLYSSL